MDPFFDELLGYLKENFKYTNANQSYGLYTNPKSQLLLDHTTNSAGYQPVRNQNVFMNPAHNRDQISMVETLLHEYAHTVQPRLAQAFNFTDPTYRMLNNIPFYDYDTKNEYPGAHEVLATLRAKDGMAKAGTTLWDTDLGKEVLTNLQKNNKNKSEQAIKLSVDKAMFPDYSMMYPSK